MLSNRKTVSRSVPPEIQDAYLRGTLHGAVMVLVAINVRVLVEAAERFAARAALFSLIRTNT